MWQLGQSMSRKPGNRVTIQTVADLAGVSPMSVSNVLNNRQKVRESTREAVMAAVRKLNYTPDLAAKSLAGAGTTRIGLLYRNIENAFLSSILLGSLETTNRLGAQLLLEPLEIGDTREISEKLQALVDNGAHAILVAPPYCELANTAGLTRDTPVPVIALSPGDDLPGEYCVRIDDFEAARTMTRRLIELGHKDIAFIRGASHHMISRTRRDGYLAALQDAGITPRDEFVIDGDMSYESGLRAAERLLSLASPPTAVFASNDDMAAAVISLAHRRGLDVPRDLAVAGFDDTPIAVKIWPTLTTVRQPGAKIASQAAALAVALSRGAPLPSEKTIHFPFEIVERESVHDCRGAAGGDRKQDF
jgi:LacI family transcriptional regulator